MIAELLRLGRQVVRIDADAVAAHQAGRELEKVPLGAGGCQHFRGADADQIADLRHFVHQRDVDVALGVLQHLRRLGDLDGGGAVHAGVDDLLVYAGNDLQRFLVLAGHDLDDLLQRMLAVARIDPLGAVAQLEIDAAAQAGHFLQLRSADFLGGAGMDGGFKNHDAAGAQHGADRAAGAHQQRKIRVVLFVDGGRNGHDEEIAAFQLRNLVGELHRGGQQHVAFDLAGPVITLFQPCDSPLVHIKADDIKALGKCDCYGQADISKATHCDSLYHGGPHCFVVSETLEIDTRGHEIDAESNMFAPVRAGVLLKNIYSSILDQTCQAASQRIV